MSNNRQNFKTISAPNGNKTVYNPRGLSYGDVVYVTGDKGKCTGKERWPNRPGIIVSKNITTESTIEVIYLSHVLKTGRYNINVTDATGKTVRACCDQIHCVDYTRVGSFLYHISDAEMYSVKKAMIDYLGLNAVDNHLQDKIDFERQHTNYRMHNRYNTVYNSQNKRQYVKRDENFLGQRNSRQHIKVY